MNASDTTSDTQKVAEQINDFQDLYPRQVAHHRYTVLSLAGDGPTAYKVNTDDMSCTCEDYDYNREGGEVCKHLATALVSAPNHIRFEEEIVADMSTQMTNMERAVQSLEDAADTAEGLLVNARDRQAEQATQTDSEDSQADETDDGENYTELQPDDAQAGMCKAIRGWVSSAQQFNSDIDPEIIQTKWIEIEGKEGVWVDRAPFYNDATYYDDGEWQDQDGFDAASEAVGDLLSNRDEFEWYGEPDYVWFVPESKVSEVTG